MLYCAIDWPVQQPYLPGRMFINARINGGLPGDLSLRSTRLQKPASCCRRDPSGRRVSRTDDMAPQRQRR
jgi:hypothetical protein